MCTHTNTRAPARKLGALPCRSPWRGGAVLCPLAWLWRGAGNSRHHLCFQALPATAGGCGAFRATALPLRATDLSSCWEVHAPTSPSIPTPPPWLRGRRIGHFHPLAIFVPLGAPLLWLPIPPVPRAPSVWLGWGLGEQEGGWWEPPRLL